VIGDLRGELPTVSWQIVHVQELMSTLVGARTAARGFPADADEAAKTFPSPPANGKVEVKEE